MEIVAGTARGLTLYSPDENDAVRPTSVRARRAFFDSLGDISGIVFADIFAGSGAMGLEAASRGASAVYFFEAELNVLKVIERNCAKVTRTGVSSTFKLIRGAVPPFKTDISHLKSPDIIFADPPYAESMQFLKAVTSDPRFRVWAAKSAFFWELPERDCSLEIPADPWKIVTIRNYGAARFLELKCQETGKK